MKIQKEDKLIIDILFKSGLNNKLLFNQVDYSILTKKLSEHLIIPAFYYNLKKKNYLKYFDPDFINYLSQIYSLNKTRNRKIIKEISKISLILESKHIEYIFIKGASNFIAELYSDIGERMITDIDILVKEQDLNKSYNLLKKIGYEENDDDQFDFISSKHRHLPSLVEKKSGIRIEIHRRIVDKIGFENLNVNEILKNKINFNNNKIAGFNYQFYINIYNIQLNDYGYKKMSYSYRNFYDSFLFLEKFKIKIKIIDKIVEDYFMKYNELEMGSIKTKNPLIVRKSMFKLFYNYNFFRTVNGIIVTINTNLKSIPRKLYQLFRSTSYRKYIIKKFKK